MEGSKPGVCFERDTDYIGGNMAGSPKIATSEFHCQELCQTTPGCEVFLYAYETNGTLVEGKCWLKDSKHKPASSLIGLISGPKNCPRKLYRFKNKPDSSKQIIEIVTNTFYYYQNLNS